MIYSSHYFEPVERFMYTHLDSCPISVLNNMALTAGCPEDQVDSVINGVFSDLIQNIISPRNKTVTITDPSGNDVPNKIFNPTRDELIDGLLKQFEGLTEERATGLVEYLINRGVLECEPITDKLFMRTYLAKSQQITL